MSEKDNPRPKTSTTEVTVKLRDVNDNVPTFPPAGYVVNLKEGDGRREVVKVRGHLSIRELSGIAE